MLACEGKNYWDEEGKQSIGQSKEIPLSLQIGACAAGRGWHLAEETVVARFVAVYKYRQPSILSYI